MQVGLMNTWEEALSAKSWYSMQFILGGDPKACIGDAQAESGNKSPMNEEKELEQLAKESDIFIAMLHALLQYRAYGMGFRAGCSS